MGAPRACREADRLKDRRRSVLAAQCPILRPINDVASLISTRLTTELVEASNKAITNLTDRSPITNDGDNNHHPPHLRMLRPALGYPLHHPRVQPLAYSLLPSRAALSTRTEAAGGSLEGRGWPSSRSTQLGHSLCRSAALPLVSQFFLKRWEPSIAAPPRGRKSRKDDGAAAARILAVHLSR